MRPIKIQPGFSKHTASIIFHQGDTIVQCSASEVESTPHHVPEGSGWITAEYSLLPSSTENRASRERKSLGGRTVEIQRLIGRSIRAVVDLESLGPRTIYLDCDVLNADGGTRCAAITGSYIALALLLDKLEKEEKLKLADVLRDDVAAISLGIIEDQIYLDLNYSEDFQADVDLNLIMTGKGNLVEIQGTAEGIPFSRQQLNEMIELGETAIRELISTSR